jgi:hypothetical protein
MKRDEPVPEIPADENDPRIKAALAELRGMILERFPEATFTVSRGEDPVGIYLDATVDIEDLDEVTNIILSRVVDMQIDEGLPVYVIPGWPEHRIEAYRREHPVSRSRGRAIL